MIVFKYDYISKSLGTVAEVVEECNNSDHCRLTVLWWHYSETYIIHFCLKIDTQKMNKIAIWAAYKDKIFKRYRPHGPLFIRIHPKSSPQHLHFSHFAWLCKWNKWVLNVQHSRDNQSVIWYNGQYSTGWINGTIVIFAHLLLTMNYYKE